VLAASSPMRMLRLIGAAINDNSDAGLKRTSGGQYRKVTAFLKTNRNHEATLFPVATELRKLVCLVVDEQAVALSHDEKNPKVFHRM
jgi:hypothetical protein